jgi:hypothetical protein
MVKIKPKVFVFLLMFVALLNLKCLFNKEVVKEVTLNSALESKRISPEINSLEKALNTSLDSSEHQRILLRLALLYSHYNNMTPDYLKAYKYFQLFMDTAPQNIKTSEIIYVYTLLKELKDMPLYKNKARDSMNELIDKNNKMENKCVKLNLEIQNLQKTIEQLKNVDLLLEKKRKRIE